MRAILAVILLALLCPVAGFAQTATSRSSDDRATARGGDITRDEYIQRAAERARRNAEKRFEKMDSNHDGVLSADERRAARAERAQRRALRQQ